MGSCDVCKGGSMHVCSKCGQKYCSVQQKCSYPKYKGNGCHAGCKASAVKWSMTMQWPLQQSMLRTMTYEAIFLKPFSEKPRTGNGACGVCLFVWTSHPISPDSPTFTSAGIFLLWRRSWLLLLWRCRIFARWECFCPLFFFFFFLKKKKNFFPTHHVQSTQKETINFPPQN